MKVSDFDFELPETLIAKHPLPERDASRMLYLPAAGELDDMMVLDLPSLVRPGDVWVLNDTRVMPARLLGQKASGGKVELLLIEPEEEAGVWRAWGKANKPLRSGDAVVIADGFEAEILERDGKLVRVRLLASDVARAIEAHGHMPLPPYIDRADTQEDRDRYQTVFAREAGAVAAPTAGLHLTEALLDAIREAGAQIEFVTLHVGPGTFQPVQVEDVCEHVMHEEAYYVSESVAEAVNEAHRVVAVGTTSLRTLESAVVDGRVQSGWGRTSIFIYPGYRFHIVDAMLTNFHLPKSTLLMLVSALAGRERVLATYEYAKRQHYRFYSYGDAMFVERNSRG